MEYLKSRTQNREFDEIFLIFTNLELIFVLFLENAVCTKITFICVFNKKIELIGICYRLLKNSLLPNSRDRFFSAFFTLT